MCPQGHGDDRGYTHDVHEAARNRGKVGSRNALESEEEVGRMEDIAPPGVGKERPELDHMGWDSMDMGHEGRTVHRTSRIPGEKLCEHPLLLIQVQRAFCEF